MDTLSTLNTFPSSCKRVIVCLQEYWVDEDFENSVLHSELRLELRSFGSKVLSHANHIMVFSLPAWFR